MVKMYLFLPKTEVSMLRGSWTSDSAELDRLHKTDRQTDRHDLVQNIYLTHILAGGNTECISTCWRISRLPPAKDDMFSVKLTAPTARASPPLRNRIAPPLRDSTMSLFAKERNICFDSLTWACKIFWHMLLIKYYTGYQYQIIPFAGGNDNDGHV